MIRFIDRMIAEISPTWGLNRLRARHMLSTIENYFGGPSGGYDAGKNNRLTSQWRPPLLRENAISAGQLQWLRNRSWDVYRNNCHARKIVRSIESKVIGRGLTPQSIAEHKDGKAHEPFRRAALELWLSIGGTFDYRGAPGSGGQHLGDLMRLALRSTILSGEVLYTLRAESEVWQRKKRSPIPLSLQLIDSARLDESKHGDNEFRGIRVNERGERIGYWLLNSNGISDMTDSRLHPADAIKHLYMAEDVDQLRGTPWFAPALMQMRDTADYQYNELKASAIAACVVLGIKHPFGSSGFGLQQDGSTDLEDADGNKITGMQPGMIVKLDKDGEIQGFNPSRPNTNAEAWIQHLLRSTAAGLPGVKSSTVTGDYRNSSFSSERSSDNDAWPELEAIQAWFAGGFCQPIYEQVIEIGVVSGWFDHVEDFTLADFMARRNDYLAVEWQGPVSRSINPTDDAKASIAEIQGFTSSPQIECAKRGRNWREILKQISEFRTAAQEEQIPEEALQQLFNVSVSASLDPPEGSAQESKEAVAV